VRLTREGATITTATRDAQAHTMKGYDRESTRHRWVSVLPQVGLREMVWSRAPSGNRRR